MRMIDLTHALHPGIPAWESSCCFETRTVCDYQDCTEPNLFRTQEMSLRAGSGTHMDAPAHCIPGGATVDQLSLQELMADGVMIGIADADERTIVRPAHIEHFEEEHGHIPRGAFVIIHTGWDARWDERGAYRNELQFPSIGEDAAKMLVERGVSGVGIDTLSPDSGGTDFPVHRVLLGAGILIIENVANAGALPPKGFRIVAAALKVRDATEAPVRLIALLHA